MKISKYMSPRLVDEPEVAKPINRKRSILINSEDISASITRTKLFMEDGDFDSAAEYCEAILDINPTNAEVYVCKLLCEHKVSEIEHLINSKTQFTNNTNFQRAIKYADDDLKKRLTDINDSISTRIKKDKYDKATNLLNSNNVGKIREGKAMFESLCGYEDAKDKIVECNKKIKDIETKEEYELAKQLSLSCERLEVEQAHATFVRLGEYQESIKYREVCNEQLKKIERDEEAAAVRKEQLRQETIKRNAKVKKITIVSVIAVAVLVVGLILISYVIKPTMNYNKACDLFEAGKYDRAISAFEDLGDFKDSEEKVTEVQYAKGCNFIKKGNYNEAINEFEELGMYKDSMIKLKEAKKLKIEASKLINGYNPERGDHCYFGTYAKDEKTSNGAHNIEWLVLDKSGDKILIISKYCISVENYYNNHDWSSRDIDEEIETLSWENCTIRKWLNDDFLKNHFTDTEQNGILSTTLKNKDNPDYGTDGGNDTEDMIFFLSIDEAKKYFKGLRSSADYAYINRKATDIIYGNEKGWWLRSPGDGYFRACVDEDGNINMEGVLPTYNEISASGHSTSLGNGVRPALWVDISRF